MKQFTFILIMTLLSPALAYSQTNGGLHVNGSHNFMVPVDSLDIRPWAADFTVSFTIDFDSIKDNATTSLLGLRSREWDGTDKADRGTLWVDCINDNDTMYLKYGFRYYSGMEQNSAKLLRLDGVHTLTIIHEVKQILSDTEFIDDNNYSVCLYVDDNCISKIEDYERQNVVSDLWWRETSHFVIGGNLSDALPYSGMLYDFKYYDMALNEKQMAASSDKENENYTVPTCHWDFLNMTADEALDSYPNEGTMPGLQALTGDFLSDAFIPVINKDYEGFDKDSTLCFYYSWATGLNNELFINEFRYSNEKGLWCLEKKFGMHLFNYLIMDQENKHFNGMNGDEDLTSAFDVSKDIGIGDIFYGDLIESESYCNFFQGADSVIDVYYADGHKNIVLKTVSNMSLQMYARYCNLVENELNVESGINGGGYLNNRYIEGIGWVNNGSGYHWTTSNTNLRMIKIGDKCMFANPLFNGYTAMNAWGGMPDSVEDAESSPASWHLLSTVASSELVITDNSGKPVCPDRVSVTSISGTVYRCAVRDDGTVDVSSLPQGFYLLTATCGDVTQTLKFIKK